MRSENMRGGIDLQWGDSGSTRNYKLSDLKELAEQLLNGKRRILLSTAIM